LPDGVVGRVLVLVRQRRGQYPAHAVRDRQQVVRINANDSRLFRPGEPLILNALYPLILFSLLKLTN
jgi:hypothetical protein